MQGLNTRQLSGSEHCSTSVSMVVLLELSGTWAFKAGTDLDNRAKNS